MIDVSTKASIARVSPKGEHGFFGYYDNSPESEDGEKILLNIAPFNDHMPGMKDSLQVGYLDEKMKFVQIGTTFAWNFQEGCRLQWIGNQRFTYNVIIDKKIKSRIYDIVQQSVVREHDYSIYSVDRVHARSVSYNLYRSRYCYAHEAIDEKTDFDNDGIFIMNLDDGVNRLVISLRQLAADVGGEPSETWIEHAVFNPAGDKFFFFHRWKSDSGGFFTRFCLSDVDGNYSVLLDSGSCSHAGWVSSNKISAWGRMPNKFNKIQNSTFLQKTGIWKIAVSIYHGLVKKPALRQKMTNDAYIIFDIENNDMYKLNNKEFTSDGHETWSMNGRYMLTDTYPDEMNNRHLMIYDSAEDIIYKLGEFYSYPEIDSPKYSEIPGIRCDLHPKWSYKEKYIYFDSTHEGYRGLYRTDVSKILG